MEWRIQVRERGEAIYKGLVDDQTSFILLGHLALVFYYDLKITFESISTIPIPSFVILSAAPARKVVPKPTKYLNAFGLIAIC